MHMNTHPSLRVFCDFDGTVCPADVGAQFLRTYAPGDAERIVGEFMSGDIGAQEYLRRQCAAVGRMTEEVFDAFADQFTVDSHFPAFVEFCDREGMPVAIVSDGLDRYVQRILERA
jgi:2-hydroxy-3-keto-5-methylthiopentenyl-1-phosphate phosphatase